MENHGKKLDTCIYKYACRDGRIIKEPKDKEENFERT